MTRVARGAACCKCLLGDATAGDPPRTLDVGSRPLGLLRRSASAAHAPVAVRCCRVPVLPSACAHVGLCPRPAAASSCGRAASATVPRTPPLHLLSTSGHAGGAAAGTTRTTTTRTGASSTSSLPRRAPWSCSRARWTSCSTLALALALALALTLALALALALALTPTPTLTSR